MPAAEIAVDARETALLSLLPEAVRSGLGTGDAVVGGRVVIERKRVDDLAASVRDGRWRDQLARMNAIAASDPTVRIAVVVEGDLPRGDRMANGISGASLESALVGAFVRDGACVFRTDDTEHTAGLIRAIADRVGRAEPPSAQGGPSASGLRNPSRKQALASSRVVAKAQLRVVPGVSEGVADAVLGACETIGEWLAVWSGREKELSDTKVRTKRLGKVLAERILSACGGKYLSGRRPDRAPKDGPGETDRPAGARLSAVDDGGDNGDNGGEDDNDGSGDGIGDGIGDGDGDDGNGGFAGRCPERPG